MRPSSICSSTSATLAVQPISLSPSSDSHTIPNSLLLVEAQRDHLLVAVLEDVQRHHLGREQHERQREQREVALRLGAIRGQV